MSVGAAHSQQQVPDSLINWPDTIYTNARIVTFDNTEINDDPGTIAEAMAVRDDVIIALGTAEEIMAMQGENTRVVDLQGKTMLPGFVHAHNHIQGPAEQKAFEIFDLPQMTPGYYLNTGVEWTADEIKAKVKAAIDQLRATADVGEKEFIGIQLFEDPDKGFPSIATASNLMGTSDPADAEIAQADVDEMVPDRMFELTVASSVQDRPDGAERNVWYKLSPGPDREPMWTEVANFEWEPWTYDQPVEQREVIDFGDEK